MSTHEIRKIVTSGASFINRLDQFRKQRIERVLSSTSGLPLIEDTGFLVVHIFPSSLSTEIGTRIDINDAYSSPEKFFPLEAHGGFNFRYNFDGVLFYEAGDRCYSFTQLFRSGVVEAVKSEIVLERDNRRRLLANDIEKKVVIGTHRYLVALNSLGVMPPYYLFLSVLNVNNSFIEEELYSSHMERDKIDLEHLYLPDIKINAIGTRDSLAAEIKPAFDLIWNAAGRAHSPNYTGEGIWQMPN